MSESHTCPVCQTPDAFGPAEIIKGKQHIFYCDCRKCGHSFVVEHAIPLEEQQERLDEHAEDAWNDILEMLSWEWKEILKLARERLTTGYQEFGDQMFRWDTAERRRNVMEELADAVVYMISGDVK